MIPFRDLPKDRQLALRGACAEAMARQTGTCALDHKVARFAAWLAPRGISFGPEDLPLPRPAPLWFSAKSRARISSSLIPSAPSVPQP